MGGETVVCASLARGIEARLLELLEDVDDGIARGIAGKLSDCPIIKRPDGRSPAPYIG